MQNRIKARGVAPIKVQIRKMQLRELLDFSDIYIQCHDFPDADAVASGFGIYCYLRANGKDPVLFYSGPSPMTKANMLIMKERLGIPIQYLTELSHEPELLITVDCAYGENNVTFFPAEHSAVIDHHICRGELPELSIVKSNYGSCSSLITRLLYDDGMDINTDIALATALYYGLYMDTNGFSEVGHPADKDLRDFAIYDKQIINTLKNANLSYTEMNIAGEALKSGIYLNEFNMAYVRTKPCEPGILGFISDLLLQVDIVDCCVVYCHNDAGYKLSVRSCSSSINASDLAKYITGAQGNGGGHEAKAGGFIKSALLPEGKSVDELIKERMISYRENITVVCAGRDEADTSGAVLYTKKSLLHGFVRSDAVAAKGEDISIRTRTGDISVTASSSLYLLLGISGEITAVSKERFTEEYTVCDEPVPVPEDYPPTVMDRENNMSRPLMPLMMSCRERGGRRVLARELDSYMKLTTLSDPSFYITGAPGDFIVINENDHKDFTIIKRDDFLRSYEIPENLQSTSKNRFE